MPYRSVFRENLFLGDVAIVTGGGTGIGKAIAAELLGLGCHVVIASRKLSTLEAARPELERAAAGSARVLCVPCSIKVEEDVKRLVKTTLDTFGKISYLVNNAGGQFQSSAAGMSLKGWKAVIDTNLTGPFLMSREVFLQHMRDHGGAIVTISAAPHASVGDSGMPHSAAARAGAENLCKSLSIEWAPCGVRVNAVAPGSVFSETAEANYAEKGADPLKSVSGPKMDWPNIPAKRTATVEEISSAVTFLLSPGARYVTGTTLVVDGGLSNVKSSVHDFVVHSYQKAWPEYGKAAVPRPDAKLLHRLNPLMQKGKYLPTTWLSFPSAVVAAFKDRQRRKKEERGKKGGVGRGGSGGRRRSKL